MESPTSSTIRPRRPHLSRNQRVAVHTLRRDGLSILSIANESGISHRQAQYAIERSDVSDSQRPGRPRTLSSSQIDELEHFVCSSRDGRFMTYLELSMFPFSHWNIGESVIRRALQYRGYERCISQFKPQITEVSKQKRLLFAQNHLDWTVEQWDQVLWTDESWITGGQHSRVL